MLLASSATVSGDTVNVKVSAANGIRPKGGTHTLTSGIDFTGKTVNLVEAPGVVGGCQRRQHRPDGEAGRPHNYVQVIGRSSMGL